ncbi:MAG: hypothetical protein KAH17_06495 [Bacteroidales bacterium]|nr:hypothetical protein [Bacteroidales bacterium]
MKKTILLASLALLIAGSSMAGQAGLFSYNQEAIELEMSDLTSLEDFVLDNPGVSLSDMIASENELVSGMTHSSAFYGFDLMNDKALGIGGFLWGCCLGPVGVLVVWLVADDPAETKRSIIGCIVNALIGGGGYFYQYTSSF